MLVFDVIVSLHGNVKVDSNLVKPGGFALPITGLKSEIRIPRLGGEQYQNSKIK